MLFDAEEEDAGRPPLGQRVGTLIEDLVENLQPLVGQPDLVGVRVEQQPRDGTGAVVGEHRPLLTTDVPGGLGHRGQDALDLRPESLHLQQPYGTLSLRPSWWRSWCRHRQPSGQSWWWWSVSPPVGWSPAPSCSPGWTGSAS